MRGCTKPPGILWVLAVHCSSEGDMLRAKHTQRAAARSLHGNHWGNRCALKRKTHWLKAAVLEYKSSIKVLQSGSSRNHADKRHCGSFAFCFNGLLLTFASFAVFIIFISLLFANYVWRANIPIYPNITIKHYPNILGNMMGIPILLVKYYPYIPIIFSKIWFYDFPLKVASGRTSPKFIIWSYLKIGYPKKTTHGFEHV